MSVAIRSAATVSLFTLAALAGAAHLSAASRPGVEAVAASRTGWPAPYAAPSITREAFESRWREAERPTRPAATTEIASGAADAREPDRSKLMVRTCAGQAWPYSADCLAAGGAPVRNVRLIDRPGLALAAR